MKRLLLYGASTLILSSSLLVAFSHQLLLHQRVSDIILDYQIERLAKTVQPPPHELRCVQDAIDHKDKPVYQFWMFEDRWAAILKSHPELSRPDFIDANNDPVWYKSNRGEMYKNTYDVFAHLPKAVPQADVYWEYSWKDKDNPGKASMNICDKDKKLIVGVDLRTGKVTYGEGGNMPKGAREFWAILEHARTIEPPNGYDAVDNSTVNRHEH